MPLLEDPTVCHLHAQPDLDSVLIGEQCLEVTAEDWSESLEELNQVVCGLTRREALHKKSSAESSLWLADVKDEGLTPGTTDQHCVAGILSGTTTRSWF